MFDVPWEVLHAVLVGFGQNLLILGRFWPSDLPPSPTLSPDPHHASLLRAVRLQLKPPYCNGFDEERPFSFLYDTAHLHRFGASRGIRVISALGLLLRIFPIQISLKRQNHAFSSEK